MADKEKVTLAPGDVGIMPSSIRRGPALKARLPWDAGRAFYKSKEIAVIRAANANDGEGFDASKPQLLVTIDGKKAIVDATEVMVPAA